MQKLDVLVLLRAFSSVRISWKALMLFLWSLGIFSDSEAQVPSYVPSNGLVGMKPIEWEWVRYDFESLALRLELNMFFENVAWTPFYQFLTWR